MTSDGSDVPRIVVGFDGSASAAKAVEWAARQAELTGSVLDVVTAWEWPNTYGSPLPLPEGFDPRTDASSIAADAERIVRDTHPSVHTRLVVMEGHAAPILLDVSKGASLLVVGCRGHGEFLGMVIGSVSEHCVAHADCPVLVLRNA